MNTLKLIRLTEKVIAHGLDKTGEIDIGSIEYLIKRITRPLNRDELPRDLTGPLLALQRLLKHYGVWDSLSDSNKEIFSKIGKSDSDNGCAEKNWHTLKQHIKKIIRDDIFKELYFDDVKLD